jgi:hypothetical protein
VSVVRLLVAFVFVLVSSGCTTALRGTVVQQSVKPPANVVVFFRVESVEELVAPIPFLPKTIHPVPDLAGDAFTVLEDGVALGDDAQAAVTPLALGKRMHVLVLVDLGGAPTEAERTAIADAIAKASAVLGEHTFGVFAFDGAANIAQLVPIGAEPPPAETIRDAVLKFRVRDASTNVHGALVEAMTGLRATVKEGLPPVQAGALVLVSRGPDRAGRVSPKELDAALADDTESLVRYAVGVGKVDAELLAEVATADPVRLEAVKDLPEAIERIAQQIADYARSYYAVSYCTPAREGSRKVRIDIVRRRVVGGEENVQRGSVSFELEAKQLRPGCKRTDVPPDLVRK